jgi:GT2 family glycosyltransferase
VCLESVFRLNYPAFRVLVCDNNSTDNSLSYIEQWATGALAASLSPACTLKKYISPPAEKPIKCKSYNRQQAEHGGDPEDKESRLVMVQTGANLGYAGGNNAGLRYAKSRGDFEYIWILNNDTLVHPEALTHMVRRMKRDRDAGMCGSTLLYYDRPDIVQTYGGGTYNKWFGYSRFIGDFNSADTPIDAEQVESEMDYIVGASVLISRRALEDVGMMPEEYFLYSEDIDWSVRAKKHYRLVYAPESIVYHKEGESSGAGNDPAQKSLLSDYYFMRSRLLFTKKVYPYALPTVYLGFIATLINRIKRKQYDRIGLIFRLLFNRDLTKLPQEISKSLQEKC